MDYEFIADFDAYMQTLDNKQYMKYEDMDGKRDTISLDRPNDRTTAGSFQTRAPLPVANRP